MDSVETIDGLSRTYKVSVSKADLQKRFDERIEEIRPQMNLKGFRPGKVPASHVKKMFGKDIMGEVVQALVQETSQKTIEDADVRPAGQPEMKMESDMEKVLSGDEDLAYEMNVDMMPDFEPVDVKKLSIKRPVADVTDEEIDARLTQIAEANPKFDKRAKTAKARKDDAVVIDFLGKLDGEPFEGGAAEEHTLVLGSNSFIPGFEDQLIGVKAGEEKAVEVTFPEEYGAENLAGKPAVFDVTVKGVKAPKAAEINDELATKFGAESLEDLKSQIQGRLEAEYAGAARQVMKRAMLDALDGMVSFDLPPSLVDAEAKQIAHQLWHEENPDVEGHDHPEIEANEEHTKLAERRVRLGLLLAELGQKAEVEVSEAEMTQAVMAQARQYPGQERAFFDFVRQNAQMQQQLRAPIFEDKVIDHIAEIAQVSEKEVSKEDLQSAVEALDDE